VTVGGVLGEACWPLGRGGSGSSGWRVRCGVVLRTDEAWMLAPTGGLAGIGADEGVRGRADPLSLPSGGVPVGFTALSPRQRNHCDSCPAPPAQPTFQMLTAFSAARYRNLPQADLGLRITP